MFKKNTAGVDTDLIKKRLDSRKAKMKLSLAACAHCTLCAESCFLFNARDNDPTYMPSYKFINSIGVLYKKKGMVDRATLQDIRDVVWERCVLCTRCYCPFGIDIPEMIAFARTICREQGVFPDFEKEHKHAG